jgi:acyl-CoA synthetase (AMP-forming)/AMP-acid ligase II
LNIVRHLMDMLNNCADRPFLMDAINNRQFSYDECWRLATGLAATLRKRSIQRGDRIAIMLDNSIEFAILYLTCLCSGNVAVPLNPQAHPRDIEFILRHSGVSSIVHSPSTRALIPSSLLGKDGLPSLCLITKNESAEASPEQDTWSIDKTDYGTDYREALRDVNPNDLLSITFTSGTTGVPKGVAHRVGGLLLSAAEFNRALDFRMSDRFYHVLPMSYMAGFLNTILCPLMAGASVVVSPAFDSRMVLRFWNAAMKYEVNTLWLVPTILSALLRIDRDASAPSYCRERIRTVCVGTAPLPLKLKREFEEKYGVELQESYGLSETLFVTTNAKGNKYVPGSVGQPLPSVALKIIAENGTGVLTGEDGEIWIQSASLMAGYLNNQTLQPDALDPAEWFPSGDIGHITPEGYLFITDRKKDLIKRGGINISPRAIEDVLMQHESIAQVAVIGLPHEFYGEEVVSVVKLKNGYVLDVVRPELDSLCRENLSSISVPTKYFQVEQFPMGTTGKVQKAKLRDLLAMKQ